MIKVKGKWAPFEYAMSEMTDAYYGSAELPLTGAYDYAKYMNQWFSVVEKYSPKLHANLKAAAENAKYVFVHGELAFRPEEYTNSPLEYDDFIKAALYRKGVIYISTINMAKTEDQDNISAKELNGITMIHELINYATDYATNEVYLRFTNSNEMQRIRLGQYIMETKTKKLSQVDFLWKAINEGYESDVLSIELDPLVMKDVLNKKGNLNQYQRRWLVGVDSYVKYKAKFGKSTENVRNLEGLFMYYMASWYRTPCTYKKTDAKRICNRYKMHEIALYDYLFAQGFKVDDLDTVKDSDVYQLPDFDIVNVDQLIDRAFDRWHKSTNLPAYEELIEIDFAVDKLTGLGTSDSAKNRSDRVRTLNLFFHNPNELSYSTLKGLMNEAYLMEIYKRTRDSDGNCMGLPISRYYFCYTNYTKDLVFGETGEKRLEILENMCLELYGVNCKFTYEEAKNCIVEDNDIKACKSELKYRMQFSPEDEIYIRIVDEIQADEYNFSKGQVFKFLVTESFIQYHSDDRKNKFGFWDKMFFVKGSIGSLPSNSKGEVKPIKLRKTGIKPSSLFTNPQKYEVILKAQSVR